MTQFGLLCAHHTTAPPSSWNVPKDFPDPERSRGLHRQTEASLCLEGSRQRSHSSQTTRPNQSTPTDGYPSSEPQPADGRRPSSEHQPVHPGGRRPGNKPQPGFPNSRPSHRPKDPPLCISHRNNYHSRRHLPADPDSKDVKLPKSPSTTCSISAA
ncbi:hypothetical protein JTE90_019427 [Oedothorax gibbosus]|uniref:Uncharacterized protein n=1 Tax=Oedothorax gibbosus TaxID=931172 RepID=A0AAV6TUK5_9ARAC|nr:hypothetical protein JTE90_019427 [Oedothorax gibbosus]